MFTSNTNTNSTATTNRENTGTKIRDIMLNIVIPITVVTAYIATFRLFVTTIATTIQTTPQTAAITETKDELILVDNGDEGMELIEASTGERVMSGRTIEQTENKETGEAEYVCLGDAELICTDPNTGRTIIVNEGTGEWTISDENTATDAETKNDDELILVDNGSEGMELIKASTGERVMSGRTIEQEVINEETGEIGYACIGEAEYAYTDPETGRLEWITDAQI